ncbi:MAG: hypothetical protein KatS3mg126_1302 [Lysobacteraceae bacterium]|nr:MAG: hypothetical protein KatS3mg126_1302 [Xanthomonadaceae bacterium]
MRSKPFHPAQALKTRTLRAALVCLLLSGAGAPAVQADDFPPVVNLSALAATEGTRFDPVSNGEHTGWSVSGQGDINGDGVDDLVISGHRATPSPATSFAGRVYVVFGKPAGFPATFDLSALDGSNGFRIDGLRPDDALGMSVDLNGDLNGDGIEDLVIAAPFADPNGRDGAGSIFVVFGRTAAFPALVDLNGLDGSNGFRVDGAAAADNTGRQVSSGGDLNGDGFDDLVIGAWQATSAAQIQEAGSVYVLFGKGSGHAPSVDLASLAPADGFRVDGLAAADHFGWAVNADGDFNGDGFDDLVACAPGASPSGLRDAGSCYLLFGRASGLASVTLSSLSPDQGFRIDGAGVEDFAGLAVGFAGDMNADGFDDLAVGVTNADPGNVSNAGSAYVIFGQSTLIASPFQLANVDGSNGFRFDGDAVDQFVGISLGSTGDVNGDGLDDLIVGATGTLLFGETRPGDAYVILGRSGGFLHPMQTSDLDGSRGFRIAGVNGGDTTGLQSVGVGDLNDDGTDDMAIGAPTLFATDRPGHAYVVYGKSVGDPALDFAGQTLIDFGEADKATPPVQRTVTIRNTGPGALEISGLSLSGPHAGDFSFVALGCAGARLPNSQSCTVTLAFRPRGAGLRQAMLEVQSNAPTSPDSLPLQGLSTTLFEDGFESQ